MPSPSRPSSPTRRSRTPIFSTGSTSSPTSPEQPPVASPATGGLFPDAPDAAVSATCLTTLGSDITVLRARYRKQHFSRHAHENYALGVIESGALAFRYRGEGLVAPAGHLSLAQPGVPHDGAPAGPDGWGYRMFYLPATALKLVLGENAPPPVFRPGVLRDPDLAAFLARTHALLLAPDAPTLAKETRFLSLLAAWVSRHAEQTQLPRPPGPEPRAVRLTLEIVAAHFAEDLDLSDLARIVGLSPWHLARVVTRATGLPPHAHLLARRLHEARELLRGPDRLADIAAATGFADQSHLTRAFRARFGLPPGAYRKIVQNNASHPG